MLRADASAVINGKLISVCEVDESSILAFSAALRMRRIAMRSDDKSEPLSFLNSLRMCLTRKILATQVGVTVNRLDLKYTLLHLQKGDIESSSTKIVDSDNTRVIVVYTVCKGSRCLLVDDMENFETSNLTNILRCLTLGIIEVSRNSHDGMARKENEIDTYYNIKNRPTHLTFLFR